MTIILPNLALAGYRSFGKEVQCFERFAKINILIGRNNSGKSNVLRAIKEVLPDAQNKYPSNLEPVATHLPDRPPFRIGVGDEFLQSESGYFTFPSLSRWHEIVKDLPQTPTGYPEIGADLIAEVLSLKAKHDGTDLAWSFTTRPDPDSFQDTWENVISGMSDDKMRTLYAGLSGRGGADPRSYKIREICNFLRRHLPECAVELIPAIRRIGEAGVDPIGYDGTGIINRLAQLERPSADEQENKLKFEAINDFLKEVTDMPDARIEIPYSRDTIIAYMDNKWLPIDCLGSGLHEVIILAAAATTLSHQIICIEEPELHLNPVLQKKFIRHLVERTENQYFITTHSAAIMDTKNAEVYHVTLVDGASRIDRVTSDSARVAVCEDLGYHPSDLLMANCVIWVEGPSDRLYLKWWIRAVDKTLTEGIHFSIMFYGGKLAAHVSASEAKKEVEEFVQLRRLNQRSVILIDSDYSRLGSRLNPTKTRLREEFNNGKGFAWITKGREVENYLPIRLVKKAVAETMPSATRIGGDGRFDSVLKVRRASDTEAQASKVNVAKWITSNSEPDMQILDLGHKLNRLVAFIKESNPAQVDNIMQAP